MKIKFIFICLTITITSVLIQEHSTAQVKSYDTTTISRFSDFINVESQLFNTPYYSFDAVYYLEDIDSVTVRDTLWASYKLNGDSMYLRMLKDTIETIQNQSCQATIYRANSSIVVQKPISLSRQILQVDVMDTLFQSLAMKGMTYVDSSCDRSIVVQFDSDAIYKNFNIHYCRLSNKIFYITYTLKKDNVPGSTKRINLNIQFSNYQTGAFTSSVFSTDPFIAIKSSSEIQLAAGMDPSYEIINLLY